MDVTEVKDTTDSHFVNVLLAELKKLKRKEDMIEGLLEIFIEDSVKVLDYLKTKS